MLCRGVCVEGCREECVCCVERCREECVHCVEGSVYVV